MPAPLRATTLRDVALAAGVSVKTVSNVVNDHPHVRPEMRARVRAVIDELDYRPHGIGRQLRQGRTGLVALALPDVTSPYYGELATELARAARARGITLLVELTDGDPDREREVAAGFSVRLVDGLIFAPLALPEAELADRRDSTPAVLIGEYGGGAGLDRVDIDSVGIGDLATTHLLAAGRRRIAFLGDKTEPRPPVVAQRVQGYRTALQRHNDALQQNGSRGGAVEEILITLPEWERRHGAAGVQQLLAEHPDVDGVVAANDLVALGALHALHRAGRRVPQDVAVVGVDDVEQARYSTPSLTTVALDRSRMAVLALQCLANRLAGDDGPPRLGRVTGTLVVRESSGG